ncbi:hypothetical protein JL721_5431 [Aureococcus anophagefferens]|nr:hypothetical protein JL721_5431 [Aureococcus anophagefferens]
MGLLPDDLRVDWSASAAAPWRVYAACSALPSAASGVVFLARGAGERKVLDAAARAPPADGARASSERDERRRVFLFLAVAFWGLYFGYYGLATWITVIVDEAHIGNTYVVALYYAAANLPGNVAAYALIDAVGRQRLLAGAMGTATLACLVNSTLAESPALLVAVTSALMCLGALATFGIREPADVVGGVAADGTSAGLV